MTARDDYPLSHVVFRAFCDVPTWEQMCDEIDRLRALVKKPEDGMCWVRTYKGRSYWQPDNGSGVPLPNAWIESKDLGA